MRCSEPRSAAANWRTALAVACNALLCEVGARVGLPGVDGSRVQQFFQTTHRGLLTLYNLLADGAVSRAAVLALGAIPYLQAEFYVWLARAALPTVRRATTEWGPRRTTVRLTTIGLALVQSFGFARFLQEIPDAVIQPGVGFIGRTVLLVTSGAVAVGWLGEVIVAAASTDADTNDVQQEHEASIIRQPAASTEAEGAPSLDERPNVPLLESGSLSDLSLPTAAVHHDLDRTR